MGGLRASALSGREVRYGDIRLGVVVDVLFDLEAGATLGFDVRGDEAHRFLPVRACELKDDHVSVESPFLLMENGYYRTRGRPLSALRGAPVVEAGEQAGNRADLILGAAGTANALVVATRDGERELALDQGIAITASPLRPAV